MSKVIQTCQESAKYQAVKGPIKWMAPESIRNLEFSLASDIWAFGVSLHEIWMDGEDPYADLNTRQVLLKMLSEENFKLKLTDKIPKAIQDIIDQCLQWNQDARPTAKSLVENFSNLQSELMR
jgi:serine/threonine protein kinase